jgi:SAM-dependent methyltransferase
MVRPALRTSNKSGSMRPTVAPASTGERSEWYYQWQTFQDDEERLFLDWIHPNTMQTFAGRKVLEGGCGGGQHTAMLARVAESVTAVDLNTTEIARERNRGVRNVRFVEADLCTMELGEEFDVVVSVGVIHHTDDPDAAFRALYSHTKPGGRLIVWTYSAEGNALVRNLVEPVRRLILRRLSRPTVVGISVAVTAALYPVIHSVYRLPFLRFLPYYEYFASARRLSFRRNMLNVFDKLNAPQTFFTTKAKCHEWFNPARFEPESIIIRMHDGVSYSLSGTKRLQAAAT